MRKLMWFTLGFLGACAFGAYCYVSWFLSAAAVCMIAAVALAVGCMWYRPLRVPAVLCVGFAFGLVWFYGYDVLYLGEARALDGQTAEVTVIVHDYSYETDYGCAVDGSIQVGDKSYRVRLYLDEKVDLEPGNRVIGTFRFRFTSSGGIDEVLHHRGKGIFLMAYQENNILVERFWSTPLLDLPAVWRQVMKDSIDRSFESDAAGFAKALLLGDRTDIDYETSTAFKVSGISHIIAVSGMHVSILFGLVYFLSGKRRLMTAAIGVPAVLLFAAMVGFTPSVTRAAIMQCLVMGALLFGKEYDPPTALGFSALVMLLGNPLTASSVSFQLSFCCMAGIFTLGEPVNVWLSERLVGKLGKGISASVSLSLGACVFTTPLTAVYFGTVSLIGVVTNLLTLWVVSFVFYGIMAVCAAGFFSAALASVLAAVVAWPIRYVLGAAKLMAGLPLAAVYTKSGYIVAWLVFCYVLLGIFLCMKKKPAVLFAGLMGLLLCLCVGLSWAEPMLDECRMTMLDVGQGQAILLQSGGKSWLVDCGGDYDEDAADVTAETLLSQGIFRLDGVILTHYDGDHAGGVDELLTRIQVDAVLLPHSLDQNGVGDTLRDMVGDGVITVKEDMAITFDGGEIALFAPFSYNSGNESSMCVLFRTENCAILITGDMGQTGERLLLKYHDLPQVDVLVVGHHGSKTSTSVELLQTVRPRYTFISVGENNFYGHPVQSVLDRLAEFGCIIYRTDEDGTIIFRR